MVIRTIDKPKIWKRKGKLTRKARVYLSSMMQLYRQTGMSKKQREDQQKKLKKEKKKIKPEKYLRESVVISALYHKKWVFDLRASIVNSTKKDTTQYLLVSLMNRWKTFMNLGERKGKWDLERHPVSQKIRFGYESEFIDKEETKFYNKKTKKKQSSINKVYIESVMFRNKKQFLVNKLIRKT